MRHPGLLTRLLYSLAAVFIGLVLFLGWLAFAISALDRRIPELVFLAVGLGPVVVYLVLSIAQGFDAALKPRGVDPFAQSTPTINWRLCDPMLSTFGLWRAEIECHPPDIDGFKNARMVKEYVGRLVRQWSVRSAWPCEVLRVSLVKPGKGDRAGALLDEKVYRVSLVDQWDGMRRGLIRFGDGFVEFQVETIRPRELPDIAPLVVEESKQLVAAESSITTEAPEINPLWDRWLDG